MKKGHKKNPKEVCFLERKFRNELDREIKMFFEFL
jgi:hypothetical protein